MTNTRPILPTVSFYPDSEASKIKFEMKFNYWDLFVSLKKSTCTINGSQFAHDFIRKNNKKQECLIIQVMSSN